LDRSRFELHLGLLQAKGEFIGDIPEDVVVHNLKVSRVRYALPSIIKLVWDVKPQSILSTLAHLNLALILGRPLLPRQARLLIREAANTKTSFLQETQHPQAWMWLCRHLYKRADRIVCLSDSMLNDLVEHFGLSREKMVRIYNPVDTEKVRELAEIGGSPYHGPGPHLVAAGRLSKEKGFDLLLNAMPAVLVRSPNAQLAILGDGPLRTDLTDQAERLGLNGAVHFLGFQPNPWPYFKYADLFVLPSRHEGFPNAMLEALTLGVPVVAADCSGGIREIADSDPQIFLVPTEDVNSLAQSVISVCAGTKGLHRQAEESKDLLARFDLQRVLAEYSSLLSDERGPITC
jgi:glycosyltransferase involved in cell wall biosynthesis